MYLLQLSSAVFSARILQLAATTLNVSNLCADSSFLYRFSQRHYDAFQNSWYGYLRR
jgi:hypothetical protein